MALAWIKENHVTQEQHGRCEVNMTALSPKCWSHWFQCFKKTRRKSHKLYRSPCQEAMVEGRKSGLWSQPDPMGRMRILTQLDFSPTLHFWKLPHFPNEAVPLPLGLPERMESCVFASSRWRRREMLGKCFLLSWVVPWAFVENLLCPNTSVNTIQEWNNQVSLKLVFSGKQKITSERVDKVNPGHS